MKMYLGKQREDAAGDVTATHGTVQQLVRRVQNKGHKVLDNYFSSLCLLTTSTTERLVLVVQSAIIERKWLQISVQKI
jgi:hypothetical protein